MGQKPTETPLPNSANPVNGENTPFTTPAARRNLAFSSGGVTPIERKQLNEQSAQVVETLRNHFGPNLFSDGLSSISAKQFIVTISYFMKNVIGNQRGPRLSTNKLSIDDITRYLIQLGYVTNKQSMSWMKTPNAMHARSKLVDLLQFLCMFFPPNDEQQHAFEKPEHVLGDDCVQNVEYIEYFNATLKDTFTLWNDNQKIEFENSKAQLINKYIQMHSSVDSKAEIENKIDKIKTELKEELRNRYIVRENNELDEMLTKEKKIRGIINELSAICEEKINERDKVHTLLHQQEKIVRDLEKQVDQLRTTIAQQPISRVKIDLQIAMLAKQRELLETQSANVSTLQKIGFRNQIKLTRTLKQLNKFAANFNIMVHEKFVAIGAANWFGFTVADLSINLTDMNDIGGQIDRIFRNLLSIHQRNACESDSIRDKIADIEIQLHVALTSFDADKVNYENVINKIALFKEQFSDVELKIQNVQDEKNTVLEEIAELQDYIDSTNIKISNLDAEIVQMSDDNKLAIEEYEAKGQHLLQIKKDRQDRLRKAMNAIYKSLQNLKGEMEMNKPK